MTSYPTLLHRTHDGKPCLLERCTLCITAPGMVNLVTTDLGLFGGTPQEFRL